METRTLHNIPTSEISPNPYNPRVFFDRDDMENLKKSISKVGILVPLTVYINKRNSPKTQYVLLDGERRWRCAKELELQTVPANIIDEPEDITQNILFMFNIHHFRREWELFPTALKLEVIIEKLGTDQESVLSSFTGVSRSMVRRCKTLLWFPKKYRNILMERDGKVSTDFFIEIYPIANRLSGEEEYYYPEGTIKLVDGLIDKFSGGSVITDVKEFREIRKAMGHYDSNGRFDKFKELIEEFISEESAGLDIFASVDVEEERTRKNILKYIAYLNASFESVNPDLVSDFYFVEQIKLLDEKLKRVLEEIE